MKLISALTVSVRPEVEYRPSGLALHKVRVSVDMLGGESFEIVKIIPNDDFVRRFDWMMEDAKKTILSAIEKQHTERKLEITDEAQEINARRIHEEDREGRRGRG